MGKFTLPDNNKRKNSLTNRLDRGEFWPVVGIIILLILIAQAILTCGLGLPVVLLGLWLLNKNGYL